MSATADMVLSLHDTGDVDQYLSFMLGGEEYALNILHVREVRSWESAAQMPNTPPYIRGVINLRGAIIPIVDLRLRLGMEAIEYGASTVVIVLVAEIGGRERTMGIVVDAVSEVHNVATADLRPAPARAGAANADADAEFIKGLANVDGQLLIVLTVEEMVRSVVEQGEVGSGPI